MGELILLYVTNPSKEEAERIARQLLDRKLIACANIFPITSIYRWEGRVAKESEYVLLAKTVKEKLGQTEKEIKKVHPYKIPCIIKISAEANKEYSDWVCGETR
jgi:periplasmic divalent cation tolerance protein